MGRPVASSMASEMLASFGTRKPALSITTVAESIRVSTSAKLKPAANGWL